MLLDIKGRRHVNYTTRFADKPRVNKQQYIPIVQQRLANPIARSRFRPFFDSGRFKATKKDYFHLHGLQRLQ